MRFIFFAIVDVERVPFGHCETDGFELFSCKVDSKAFLRLIVFG